MDFGYRILKFFHDFFMYNLISYNNYHFFVHYKEKQSLGYENLSGMIDEVNLKKNKHTYIWCPRPLILLLLFPLPNIAFISTHLPDFSSKFHKFSCLFQSKGGKEKIFADRVLSRLSCFRKKILWERKVLPFSFWDNL